MKIKGLGSLIHIYMKVVLQKKNTLFTMNYDRESVDKNPLRQIINDQLYQLY